VACRNPTPPANVTATASTADAQSTDLPDIIIANCLRAARCGAT
jgi:hypothetical protein